ncbi:hypothetical protein PICST_28145 [Scheffersomyces stipitis CBS 6054]|uniref:Uncharacterized protein n=1 Tax=Scheffersomyces stipitis (strain ATCC 58785 / CBS 6054 / NBRC 10063 / NRRL Y-11545) TaxID=322104 RepID=A3GF75_PICST|nr:predicted protein [Scheffersomyces stipitis CBS 6054]EAZ63303.2 hypothetical protein PICST_28145 [Scheffersomyces stipitis CBS 6054]
MLSKIKTVQRIRGRYFPVYRASGSQLRWVSTLLEKDPNSITVDDIKKSSLNNENQQESDIEGRINLIKTIGSSKNEDKQALINELIPNFSVYFRLQNLQEEPAINTKELLGRLIDVNPGRVLNSWELFKKYEHLVEEIDHQLINSLFEKLLNGEKSEISDDPNDAKYKITMENLEKIKYLLQTYTRSSDSYNSTLMKLVDRLVEDEYVVFINFLLHEELLSSEFLINHLSTSKTTSNISNYAYLSIFKKVFDITPELLNKEQLVSALDILGNSNVLEEINKSQDKLASEIADSASFKFVHSPLDLGQLRSDILKYIEVNLLDLDKSPESLLIRLKLIEAIGIENNDLDNVLKKYHTYQTHEKFGIELVQTKLLQAFVYQAINLDNESFVTIAETLQPTDNHGLPVKVLQLLMIAHANFDSEKSLRYYNDYIQRVSKGINEHTKRSASGLLTESLILSQLYGNDRNFATLVFEMAIDKGVISDELEISLIKKLFKVYGESFVEDDDWEKAKKNLKTYVLDYVKKL